MEVQMSQRKTYYCVIDTRCQNGNRLGRIVAVRSTLHSAAAAASEKDAKRAKRESFHVIWKQLAGDRPHLYRWVGFYDLEQLSCGELAEWRRINQRAWATAVGRRAWRVPA
jgi:hypothetical protein